MKIIPSKDGTKFGLVVSKEELRILGSFATTDYIILDTIFETKYGHKLDKEKAVRLWSGIFTHVK